MTRPADQLRSEAASFTADEWPLSGLRDEVVGIGGVLRQRIEDFVVEEIPAYEPSGTGEHLFLWIEKQGLSSEQLTWHIARRLGISNRDIGVAGMKDRWATTRQFVSVPSSVEGDVGCIENDHVSVLRSALHGNKLRSGHLRGNRLHVVVRDVADDALQRADIIGQRIAEAGFPNYYGEQRFGKDNETLATGLELLSGKKTPRELPKSRRRFLLRFSLSSVQSYLFNDWLARRIDDGLSQKVMRGDVMQVIRTGGVFLADELPEELSRFDSGETVLTGPIFGPKMKWATDLPGKRESDILTEHGLSPERFSQFSRLTSGTRRAAIIRPQDLSIKKVTDGLQFDFALSRGVYATSLLREFMLE